MLDFSFEIANFSFKMVNFSFKIVSFSFRMANLVSKWPIWASKGSPWQDLAENGSFPFKSRIKNLSKECGFHFGKKGSKRDGGGEHGGEAAQ